ncbi:MAG: hypothetical protein ABIJ08_02670 [Nanoarchaeota archaeon]
MAKCEFCGKKIQPYFGICFECYQDTTKGSYQFPEKMVRADFIREMATV